MREVNVFVETTAKRPGEQDARYIAILEMKTPKGAVTLQREGELHGTKNNIELQALKMALERVKMRVSLNLFIDSEYIFNAFEQGLPEKWQKNGWKTAKNVSIANETEWREIESLLKGKPFEIHIKQEHEYRSWMENELRRKGEIEHV